VKVSRDTRAGDVPARPVTKQDVEAKLRALQGGVEESIASRRQQMIAAGIGIVVLTLLITFLLGRRAGRRKSTVVEIRRF
jgi:hypothetical protein